MIIRELEDGVEYTCTEDEGEIIRCPICKEIWMQEIEGDCTDNHCRHLRFVFPSEAYFIDTYGNWDSTSYIKNFEAMRDRLIEEDNYDEMTVFERLTAEDIDEIVFKHWNDMPLVQWSIYWGFKKE